MTISLAMPRVHERPCSGSVQSPSWSKTAFTAMPEERSTTPDRPSIRLRKNPQRLASIAIVAFYIVCALAIVGAPHAPDMLAVASP